MQKSLGYRYRALCLTCAASSMERRGVSRYPPLPGRHPAFYGKVRAIQLLNEHTC